MKTQIETYQREIEIHKEVEKELAKRSHFCQKVIKRLKQELHEAVHASGKANSHMANNLTSPKSQRLANKSMDLYRSVGGQAVTDQELARGNDDLINFLEKKLEQQEKKLMVKQQEYDTLMQDHQNLQSTYNASN